MASARRVRLPVVLAALAVAAASAGCATAPSGGLPRRATGSGNQAQAYVQPLPPPPPTSSWPPADVVLGFLHASASYAFDPAAAERYLAPALRKRWHPASGPVAVVGLPDVGPPAPYKPQIQGETTPGQLLESVEVSGQRLATLSQTGQYQFTPGQSIQYQFILAKTDGTWLIRGLPAGLLLTQSDFEEVYQARNLFFYAPGTPDPGGVLVPDPVYAPLQSSNSALNTNLATRLVDGLLKDQGNWLSAGATWSAFPAGTHLIKQVTITGRVAQVDLGGGAVDATPTQKQLMEAQLRATLGDRSYSQPLANQVQLYINNALVYSAGRTLEASRVASVSTGPVLVVTGPSSVGQLPSNLRAKVLQRLSSVQIGRGPITAIAAEPTRGHTPQVAVAVQDGTGCAVFLKAGSTQAYASYVLATSGGTCTSLSWDNNGNLWAAAGQHVWVLRAQNRTPVAVDVTALAAVGQPGSKFLALRMAPDNVRAALLVQTKSGNELLLAAVHFDGSVVAFGQPVSIGAGGPDPIADPIAVSWFDAYHLAVLGRDGPIFDVPLTGGAGLQPGGLPVPLRTAQVGARTLTLTTDGSELVVGTSDGHIFASSLASQEWSRIASGYDPVYPG